MSSGAPTPAPSSSHWAKSVEEEDRVETLIRSSGCWDNHIEVVDCMGEKGDWRQCQAALTSFKTCMTKNRPEQYNNSQKK